MRQKVEVTPFNEVKMSHLEGKLLKVNNLGGMYLHIFRLRCIFVLTLIVPANIQSDLNNVQSRTFSKETWWGHNIDNSIDNFDILLNVAEPSHFIEEREWGEVTIRQT